MIEPPYEELKALKEYADKHNMGLASAMDENCIVILMGKRDKLHINEVAIVCAYMLLQGVMNGTWSNINENAAQKEVTDLPPSGHTH